MAVLAQAVKAAEGTVGGTIIVVINATTTLTVAILAKGTTSRLAIRSPFCIFFFNNFVAQSILGSSIFSANG